MNVGAWILCTIGWLDFSFASQESTRKPKRGISAPTFSIVTRYNWPGNVRELKSVMKHAALCAQGDYLMARGSAGPFARFTDGESNFA